MNESLWNITESESPLVATAIHDGHWVREEVADFLEIRENDRLREEDPYTGKWVKVAPNQLVARRSRFEVDLNRPRNLAVYTNPEQAWGLHVYKGKVPGDLIERSLTLYDAFYAEAHRIFYKLSKKFGHFIVLDLHTYNHKREGANGPEADPEKNPEVNIGTKTMDRKKWGPVVDRFISDLSEFNFLGRKLDVRENVKFLGGNLGKWTHQTFPESGCVLSVEFKKFFMDEWTGQCDEKKHAAIGSALSSTTNGLLEELEKLNT
jgi:N-formylglutamate deformylase